MNEESAIIDDKASPVDVYLASASPRRGELLEQLGLTYETVQAPIEEVALPGESAESYVRRMAIEKALNGFQKLPGARIWVIGGDTLIRVEGAVLEKPKHEREARNMLRRLGGRSHEVLSAVALVHDGAVFSAVNQSRVQLREISDQECRDYWLTGEPQDKAGGYAIQGQGARFVERLDGSYSGVMGLPLFELDQLLRESGFWSQDVE
ncbi:nucleoside triphosphate pyrophosphatase [Thiomicrospira sp. WB1]|uniref:Maf family protein n=1 Tax=Thiomicrospira sp. WB1 TaxID=1685380 RepID=UPI000749888C|nr:Maf family protein [Thiomicrospira sp. WB1]KUJ71923.1 septum formation inhibitor Maf [Thiomicrospira sp. WB1]